MSDSDPRRLQQQLPAELEKLLLDSRAICDQCALTGLHRSPIEVRRLSFANIEALRHGDDLRRLDWRVYAKSDRLYVKQFEDETTLAVEIVVDTSSSMNYHSSSTKVSKFARTQLLAAAIADLAIRQGDAVHLWSVSDNLEVLTEQRRQRITFS